MALRRPALGFAAGSAALRARADRLGERMEALPRPPFVIAAVAAVVLLVAALAGASGTERRAAEVGVFTGWNDAEGTAPAQAGEGEVEILEYGFGVIELNGLERLTLGAVVRNPNPEAFARLVIETTADGGRSPVETFRVNYVAPGSDVLVSRIFADSDAPGDLAGLEPAIVEASYERFVSPPPVLPERFTVVEVEPLLSPPGQRIVYRIESGIDAATGTRPDVVFRDADGAIVGGLGGDDHVVDGADANSSIRVVPGTSVHHFNLRSEEIPDGADLLRTEIGPGGVIPGG